MQILKIALTFVIEELLFLGVWVVVGGGVNTETIMAILNLIKPCL